MGLQKIERKKKNATLLWRSRCSNRAIYLESALTSGRVRRRHHRHSHLGRRHRHPVSSASLH
jgi:hypothetical protein